MNKEKSTGTKTTNILTTCEGVKELLAKIKNLDNSLKELPYSKRRLAGYYLRQWYKLKKNIDTLSISEMKQAKLLFTALSKLNDDEQAFLAMKYDSPSIKDGEGRTRLYDAELATQLGISLSGYRKKRRALEYKLSLLIDDIRKNDPDYNYR